MLQLRKIFKMLQGKLIRYCWHLARGSWTHCCRTRKSSVSHQYLILKQPVPRNKKLQFQRNLFFIPLDGWIVGGVVPLYCWHVLRAISPIPTPWVPAPQRWNSQTERSSVNHRLIASGPPSPGAKAQTSWSCRRADALQTPLKSERNGQWAEPINQISCHCNSM